MFIETQAAMIVPAPILAPVAIRFGVNLFPDSQAANLSLERIVSWLLPFILIVSLFFRDLLGLAGSWIGRRGDYQGDFSCTNECC
jgi:TRAP-type C4-dicarboxylate transport system permease large subunit